jgi:glycosyl transferase family 25
VRRLLPQPLRLRLWLLRQWFTRESFLLRRAQPSRWQRLRARAVLRRRATGSPSGVERLSGVMVINLASRPDRLAAFTAETERLDLHVERLEGIQDANGALGCSLSHVECARRMLARSWESMMVCEDDVEFRVGRRELDVLLDEFLDDPEADVACLAYFAGRTRAHSALYLRGSSIRTMACYILKRAIAEELVETWMEGVEEMRKGGSANRYICDKMWMPLQRERVFLVPVIRAAAQREGYSEVQRRVVSYSY